MIRFRHLAACIVCAASARGQAPSQPVEEIFVVRTWREARVTPTAFCADSRVGFRAEIEDSSTLRSVEIRDGRLLDDNGRIVGGLRACFATVSAGVSRYFAKGRLGAITFTGSGECELTRSGFPEAGMSVGVCHVELTDLPPGYAGGALTTNTLNSRTLIGESMPPGYTQPAIATIRLWKTRRVTECTVAPPAGAERIRPAHVWLLAGEFDVTLLTLAGDVERTARPMLTLRRADSSERARARLRRIGYVQRTTLQLTGHVGSQPAEVDDGVLYLGCRDCNDASPDMLQIERVSEAGFWGSWRNFQTGIGVAVDSRGVRLPDPSGRFCAIRRPER